MVHPPPLGIPVHYPMYTLWYTRTHPMYTLWYTRTPNVHPVVYPLPLG